MKKLFFAWLAGWLLTIVIGLGLRAARRRIVISAVDAGEWQKITGNDIGTLRHVSADPIVGLTWSDQRGPMTIVIDRGAT